MTPQLTHIVSDMYYKGELVGILLILRGGRGPLHVTVIETPTYIEIVVAEQSARKYAHSPSETCKIRGESLFIVITTVILMLGLINYSFFLPIILFSYSQKFYLLFFSNYTHNSLYPTYYSRLFLNFNGRI